LAAAIVAMERVVVLIGRCTIYEQLYLSGNDMPDIAENATENLRGAMVALYTAILQTLSRLMMIFQGMSYYAYLCQWATNKSLGKTNILKPPDATLAELKAMEQPESNVDLAASAVDKCCEKKSHPKPTIILIIGVELMHG